ncbi:MULTISPECIES: cation diffusion facilitator family transporter [Staphylococcus]|uniref:Cation transporter n=1 Tax=Staphylococcus schleiferi TaxID=1295 RepID=A0ABX0FX76_STASC|nr:MULTISPECIES: cation diffusion facilitator family transporter [Staphylococcus]QGS46273.1 cation diffusion facilitator family transporter [Mammaliicoccus fleurettii]EPD49099.1 cation diffusion facilitator family transporter [Staphylococcus sp. HGB0015]MBF1993024.1 cation transporter [Staphylococcus schleiferi]MBF2038496.1 cation transporter [Staphylococcus schleiferi]MBF2100451.1 cation transporter [Staphylococcus schleiferi]
MSRGNYFHHVEHRKKQTHSKMTLWLSLIITLFFTVVEFSGGIISNSLALLSDSFHMLSDVFALALSMLAVYFASRKPTARYTFGYLRFEILAAFLNGLALAVISAWIFYEAIVRIIFPKPVESGLMLVIATIGLIVNIVLTIILVRSLKSENNINIQSALWHFMGDLLNSIGVIVAVVLIYFTGIQLIDPILSMVIALVILRGGYKIMHNAWLILMESVPEHLDTDEIMETMKSVNQVLDVHEFHLWSITTEHYSLSAHVVLDSRSSVDAYQTINKLETLLKEKYGLAHTTLQIEHLVINHLDEAYFEEVKNE